MSTLQNRNYLVVGGTSGIGKSVSEGLSQRGANVVALGLKVGDGESSNGQPADAESSDAVSLGEQVEVIGDARNAATIDEVLGMLTSRWQHLHGLVHVAGGSGRGWGDGPLHEISEEGWSKTLELNLATVMLSNRAAIRQFLAQESGGAIVNVGSVMASAASPRGFSTHAYIAAKAGIVGLSQAAAAHYVEHDIRINVVQPGLIETPMSTRAQTDETIQHYVKTKQPLDGGRMGKVNDVNGAILFLLSPEAGFVTGQVVSVDGGWSVSEGQWR